MNGRGTNGTKQLYYKGYRLIKKEGNLLPTPEIGDKLADRGDGTFFGGDDIYVEVLQANPTTDAHIKFLISFP